MGGVFTLFRSVIFYTNIYSIMQVPRSIICIDGVDNCVFFFFRFYKLQYTS